jgi:hypothetical protein
MLPKFAKARWIVAAVSGLVVFSMVFAFAAALNVSSNNLSAGTSSVASCDTDGVTTVYTVAYDESISGYAVSTVTVTGIATACNFLDFSVTLAAGSDSLGVVGTPTAELSGSDDAMTLVSNFASQHVPAHDVTAVYVAVSSSSTAPSI